MFFFFFFNDTATTEIYTLSLHDALPICSRKRKLQLLARRLLFSSRREQTQLSETRSAPEPVVQRWFRDRKSTRLNSSHQIISYAVFCLKKKKHNRTYEKKRVLFPTTGRL